MAAPDLVSGAPSGGTPLTISAGNSSTTPLSGAATFTGSWDPILKFNSISIIGSADVAGTLWADFSLDGSTASRSIQLSTGLTSDFGIHSLIPVAQYFRVRVINGAGAQSTLELSVLYSADPRIAQPTSRIGQAVTSHSDVLNARSVLFGSHSNNTTFSNVPIDENDTLAVHIDGPVSAFGEVLTSEPDPIYQIQFPYGIMSNIESFVDTGASGSVTASAGQIVCQTGTNAAGFGLARAKRAAQYRAGQGLQHLFTSTFATAVADSLQLAGPHNATDGYFFGYNGTSFGVMHRHGGLLELQTLTISTPASGSETATVTLNGVAYGSISLTNSSAEENAFEIATGSAFGGLWEAWSNGDTVVFLHTGTPADLAGSFSLASTGAAAGSFVETTKGAAYTQDWTASTSWNIDHMDGGNDANNPSGFDLDPTLSNVYRVDMQHLGHGHVFMSIEGNRGRFVNVHKFALNNAQLLPSLRNPHLKVGWAAANAGNTSNLAVKGTSATSAVQGRIKHLGDPYSERNVQAGVGTTLINGLAFRVRGHFGGIVNLGEILPKKITCFPDADAIFEVYLNPTIAGVLDWSYKDQALSIVEVATDNGAITGGTLIDGKDAPAGTTTEIDLSTIAAPLQRNDVYVLAVSRRKSGSAADMTVTFSWQEDK